MSPVFNVPRSNDGASGAGGAAATSSGPSTSKVRAVEVAPVDTGGGGGGGAAGGVRPARAVDDIAVAVGVTLAVEPRFAVAVKRPLGDRRPSSFASALWTARTTVSSAPAAAC